MAAKNQKSSTLPPGLKYSTQQSEENEGFFSKLKKKLKLKKGKYTVDVNTGECDNIAPVSFKKRESRDLLDESPWKLREPDAFPRETRSQSPNKHSKQAYRTQSDRFGQDQKLGKTKHERKHSYPEHQILALKNSARADLSGSSDQNSQHTTSKSRMGNEYSRLDYETTQYREASGERVPRLGKGSIVVNDCIGQDDSAIDLDNVDTNVSQDEPLPDFDFAIDPGYEKLPVRRKISAKSESSVAFDMQKSPDWDPRYEAVSDVKKKIKEQFSESRDADIEEPFDPRYQSVSEAKGKTVLEACVPACDDLIEEDPGYQSVRDVKRDLKADNKKPPKTYNINQSIESLDEPGYESLNEVKKKISELNATKNDNKMNERSRSRSASKDSMNDSALEMTPKPDQLPLDPFHPQGSRLSERRHSGTPDSQSGIKGLTEIAVSLTEIATALTGSCVSKDSGFQSKERSVDSELEDNMYSTVKKSSSTSNDDPLYSSVNKKNSAKSATEQQPGKDLDPSMVESKTPTNQVEEAGKKVAETVEPPVIEGYDSETELMLDPGYAECADAIKGFIPYSIYSDGSGSKISSCTSLDLSAEDFVLEPGYAECADAIKSGAIKKVSVSHERLFDYAKDDTKLKPEPSSEIYANPQILFRKRSKLLEGGVSLEGLDKSDKNDTDADYGEIEGAPERKQKAGLTLNEKKKRKKGKVNPPVAPPLPARNYSLYLEGEDAEIVVNEVLEDIAQSGESLGTETDDAFDDSENTSEKCSESDSSKSNHVQEKVEKSCTTNAIEQEAFDIPDGVCVGNTSSEPNCNENELKDQCQESNEKIHNDQIICAKDSEMKCSQEDVSETVKQETVSLETEKHVEKDKLELEQCFEGCSIQPVDTGCEKESVKEIEKTGAVTKPCNNGAKVEDDNECLHVKVKDTSGNEKVLKIVEREESFKIREKRRNSREKNKRNNDGVVKEEKVVGNCDNEKSTNCTEPCVTFNKSDACNTKDETCLTTNQTSNNSTGCTDSTNISSEVCTEVVTSDKTKEDSTNTPSTKEVESPQIAITCPTLERNKKTNEACAGLNCENVDIEKKIENVLHSANTGCPNGIDVTGTCGLATYQVNHRRISESNDFLCVNTGNINAVKMKSISIDSECDFLGTEDLPKLEINESDLESPFDSSSNSNNSTENLDIATESAVIVQLTNDLTCKIDDTENDKQDLLENNNVVCSDTDTDVVASCEAEKLDISQITNAKEEDNKSDCLQTVCMLENSEDANPNTSLTTVVNTDELTQGDAKGSLGANSESAMELTEGPDIPNSSRGNPSGNGLVESKSMANAETEVSDDSAIENNDEDDKDEHELDVTMETEDVFNQSGNRTANISGEDREDISDVFMDGSMLNQKESVMSASLPLTYKAMPSGWYEDNEPTHMSLEEVMGRSHPGFSSVFKVDSPLGNEFSFSPDGPNMFSTPNIPNFDLSDSSVSPNSNLASGSDPPPRPPPVANSQSVNRSSNSSQSSQSTVDTPLDETPPMFRFAYGSGQSDEESPPAIPPRTRIKKNSRRPVSYSQDFMESMRQLKDCGWYWGPLSWEEAETKLSNKPEGTFLVRDSSDERYILSLSFKNQGRVHHTRIEHHKGHFSFWSQPDSHGKSTIKEFIEQCVENSRNGRFLYFIRPSGPGSPPMPIHLLHPVSRFVQMRSLQHMCRFRILQLVRRDHIDHLPIPTRIKQYLKEAQYYVEYLDD